MARALHLICRGDADRPACGLKSQAGLVDLRGQGEKCHERAHFSHAADRIVTVGALPLRCRGCMLIGLGMTRLNNPGPLGRDVRLTFLAVG